MHVSELALPADADELLEALADAPEFGLDTEFMRERTYFARLCLLQIVAGGAVFLLDPLGDPAPEAFWTRLLDRSCVLHSGRQDIEVIFQTTRCMPASLFDTQVAAALLGYPPQIGYANLVKTLFDRDLPKSHTRADWTRRPLSEAMRAYAVEDVEYLLDAREHLTDKLQAKGRLDWAAEDSAALLDPSLYASSAQQAVDRLKAARNLRGRQRRAAVALAEWREKRAIAADRPRQWVLKDAVLIDIAIRNPDSTRQLANVEGLPAGTVRRAGDDILGALAAAVDGDDNYQPPGRPGEREKAQLKAMQQTVAQAADELDIAAEVIAPRKELSALMLGNRDVRALTGWRRTVVGERLLALLD
ncbi:MAG: ribonuclease D [Pseudomonadota bacterium]